MDNSTGSDHGEVVIVAIDDLDEILARAVRRALEGTNARLGTGGDEKASHVVTTITTGAVDEALSDVRRRFGGDIVVVGVIAVPDPTLWKRAERAGYDVVVTRGSVSPILRRLLSRPRDASQQRLLPLLDVGEVAGRVGHLADVDVPALGVVSLWRVDGRLLCTGLCTHQGVSLSRSEIDGTTVACPAHGSRFDLVTGERLRGPADSALACYSVTEANGRIHLVRPLS
ncbi:MAG: Rieske 2Fe-2S domain-containing protein [Acidimicrobiaceae bacterium]|nr:Rieske 2Fe-2S domain-containing protein [Acidimicrobiaceae bacterium]